MSGGLEDGHHEVWSCLAVWIMDVWWPGHVSPLVGEQKVIWKSGVYSDEYPGIDRTGKFKKFEFLG